MTERALIMNEPALDAACEVIAEAHLAIGHLGMEAPRLARWAELLRDRLLQGALVLTAGNGGSAAHAAHLAGELIGRFRDERRPLRSICLSSDGPAVTAIANDYGYGEVFARQVRGLARAGDVVVLFSTSGRSPNLLAAAEAARQCGALTLAFTGPDDNPLRAAADDAVAPRARDTASIQDAHQVALHALCASLDRVLGVEPAEVAS